MDAITAIFEGFDGNDRGVGCGARGRNMNALYFYNCDRATFYAFWSSNVADISEHFLRRPTFLIRQGKSSFVAHPSLADP